MREDSFKAFGSDIIVSLPEAFFVEGFERLQQEAIRIENKFSRFNAHSELSVTNRSLNQWHRVDAEWIYLINQFLELQTITGFHLTLASGKLLAHWGYDQDYDLKVAAEPTVAVDLKIEIKGLAFKTNLPLDFGCLGKGYFLDQSKHLLADTVDSYLINAGGDIIFKNNKAERFYLEDPRVNHRVIGEIELLEACLCASSPSRRKWAEFHHLVDWKNQAPAAQMSAVYVVSQESGLITDALSTAFYVMGFETAQSYYQSLQIRYPSLALILISADGKIWQSANANAQLYSLKNL